MAQIDLSEIRKLIDQLDRDLIEVVAKRMALIPGVARYKGENDLPRYQPSREEEIFQTRREWAAAQGMNPDLAEKILKLIIEDAHRIEKEILGE